MVCDDAKQNRLVYVEDKLIKRTVNELVKALLISTVMHIFGFVIQVKPTINYLAPLLPL